MPGTHPETTIPATAPGESTPLAAKAQPDIPPNMITTNPVMSASRRESVVVREKKASQLKQFVDDNRHFSLIRNFRLADVVTILNGFCGIMSIMSCCNYLITSNPAFLNKALWFPLAGLIFDFLDGRVARWRNESSTLGQELDSLADSISFGVAPAIVAFCIGLQTGADMVILTLFCCCGMARLARFNATVANVPKDSHGKAKFFEGLPIPSTLALVGAMAECVRRDWIEGVGGRGKGLPFGLLGMSVELGVPVHIESIIFATWGALMISKTLKVPKP